LHILSSFESIQHASLSGWVFSSGAAMVIESIHVSMRRN
jgi:hypothetical protein